MKRLKRFKRASIIGLSILSQLSFAVARPLHNSARKALDLSIPQTYMTNKSDQQSVNTDILAVFNQAKETEPELAKALGEIEAAIYNIEAEHNKRYGPTISLAAGVSFASVPIEGWTEQIGISFNQSIWNVPQDKLIERASVDLSKAEVESQIRLQTLIASVVEAYFNALKAQDILSLRLQVIRALEQHYEIIKQEFDVGMVTQVDLDRVQSNLDAAKAQKNTAETNLKNALDTLRNKWDLKIDKLAHLKDKIQFAPPTPADPNKWKEIMMASSLLIQRDAMSIQGLQIDIDKERAELTTPKVNFGSTCSLQDAVGVGQAGCSVGLTVNQTIFNSGYTNSKTKSLGAKKSVARYELDNDRRKSLVRIDVSFEQINLTLNNIAAYEKSVKNAESVIAGLQEQYLNGISTSNELLNAIQQTLVPFKESLLSAKYAYFTQEVELKLAAGTLSVVDLLEINKMLTFEER